MIIEYSPTFKKMYRKLPNEVKNLAEKKEVLFRQDQFHPSLQTHKLHGKMSGFYAFSINYKYRIIFDVTDKGVVRFHEVGGHGMYE